MSRPGCCRTAARVLATPVSKPRFLHEATAPRAAVRGVVSKRQKTSRLAHGTGTGKTRDIRTAVIEILECIRGPRETQVPFTQPTCRHSRPRPRPRLFLAHKSPPPKYRNFSHKPTTENHCRQHAQTPETHPRTANQKQYTTKIRGRGRRMRTKSISVHLRYRALAVLTCRGRVTSEDGRYTPFVAACASPPARCIFFCNSQRGGLQGKDA